MSRFTRRTMSIIAIGAIALAACGGDDDDASTDTTASTDATATPTEAPTTIAPTTMAPTTMAPTTEPDPGSLYGPTETDVASTAAPGTTTPTGDTSLLALGDTELGQVLVAADGLTLYLFTPDSETGLPTCSGGCADNWPPYFVEEGVELTAAEGLDASLLSTVEHPDGGTMLKYGDWPLYYFAADQAPGDTEGQGANDVWWVVDAAGEPVLG